MNPMMMILALSLSTTEPEPAVSTPATEKPTRASGKAKPVTILREKPADAAPDAAGPDDPEVDKDEDEDEAAIEAAATARRKARVTEAKCALALATGLGTACTVEATSRRSPTITTESVAKIRKGGGIFGGTVSEPVAELLGLVTEIAVERAKQNGLAFLQRRIRRAVCGVELPWPAPKEGAEANAAFPATCKLLEDVPLDQLAEDPRRILPALVADLVGTVGTTTWAFVREKAGARYAVVAPAIDVALRLAVAGRLGKASSPSSSEVVAVLNTLLAKRCSIDGGTVCVAGTWAPAPAVAIALEVLAELVARNGEGDVATLVAELSPTQDAAIIARAVELAAIGVRALGIDKAEDAREPRAQWTAAMAFVFETAIDVAEHGGKAAEKAAIEHLRDLTVAIADENVPAAVSAGASLLGDLLESRAPCAHGGKRSEVDAAQSEIDALKKDKTKEERSAVDDDAKNTCEQSVAIAKVTALLGGVASYSATYIVEGNEEKTAAELRASRKEALESLIDATTKRTNRGGDFVVSLGIPVGFSVGGQWKRVRKDAEASNDGTELADLELMAPQLAIPLGFGFQKLVGHARRPSPKTRYGDERIQFNGLHAFVTMIDLGQFVAYDAAKNISRPRWDSLFSPGAQLGWAFGTPANTFVLAGEVRYAPTLFAGTSGLDLKDSTEPGGALRLGIMLAYYVSLFDFN